MAIYKFVVFTNAAEGRDSEFNRWYDEVHLGEVLAVPGFAAASRYRILPKGNTDPRHRYLAIYEIETEDAQSALNDLMARALHGELQMSETMAPDVQTMLVEELITVKA